MRTFGKWLIRVVLLAALAAAVVGLWKREEIQRLLAVNSLFSKEKIVHNFTHMNEAFLTTPVPRGDRTTVALPYGPEPALPDTLADWVADRAVTSLVVLKDGEIVFEEYYLGTTAQDMRISWSVAKSYLSALMGVLLSEGAITSLDEPVTNYAPRLKGTAYDGATIRNVMQMTSGVTFDEDYMDRDSDINRMGRVIAVGGELDTFTASLNDTFAEPGQQWQYVSIDTHVIGMVIRGATGRPLAELLSEKIIAPLGQEYAPYYLTDGDGVAFVLGGLNNTTRDLARFGQMYAQHGQWNGVQIVPEDWVIASTTASAPTEPEAYGYGFQWWIPAVPRLREYLARGIYGQYIYINEPQGTVIVMTPADRAFRDDGVDAQNLRMFRSIADAL